MCQEESRSNELSEAGISGNSAQSSAGNPTASDVPTGHTGSGSGIAPPENASRDTSAKSIQASTQLRDGLLLGLRDWRKRRQLSCAELATRCGVNGAHLSQVERGLKCASLPLAVRLARELEVGVRDLLEEIDLFGGRRNG